MEYQDIDKFFLEKLRILKKEADEKGIPSSYRQIRIGIEYAKRLFLENAIGLRVYGMDVLITSEIWKDGMLIQLWIAPPAEKIGEI